MPQSVNLLPDDFRRKEEKIRQKREQRRIIPLHIPLDWKVAKREKSVKHSNTSLWERLRKLRVFPQKKGEPTIPPTILSGPKSVLQKEAELEEKMFFPEVKEAIKESPRKDDSEREEKKFFFKKRESPKENLHDRLHIPRTGFFETLGVNLAQGAKKLDFGIRRWIFTGILFTLFFFGLGAGRWYVSFKESKVLLRLSEVQKEESQLEEELQGIEALFESTLVKMVKAHEAQVLLEERLSWIHALDFLEENTAEGIQYKTLKVLHDGSILLEVKARDYETLVHQFLIFDIKKDIIESYQFGNIESVDAKDESEKEIRVELTLWFQKEYLKNISSS